MILTALPSIKTNVVRKKDKMQKKRKENRKKKQKRPTEKGSKKPKKGHGLLGFCELSVRLK